MINKFLSLDYKYAIHYMNNGLELIIKIALDCETPETLILILDSLGMILSLG